MKGSFDSESGNKNSVVEQLVMRLLFDVSDEKGPAYDQRKERVAVEGKVMELCVPQELILGVSTDAWLRVALSLPSERRQEECQIDAMSRWFRAADILLTVGICRHVR